MYLYYKVAGSITNALCTLFETVNGTMGSYHDKMSEALYKDGVSENYVTLQKNGYYNTYEYPEEGFPIEKRTAYHMAMSLEIINSFNILYPDKPILVTGMPDPNYMIENGLEATLKSLA